MSKNKRIEQRIFILLVMLVFLFLFTSISVHALGISPARRVFKIEQGDSSGSIKILNDENKDIRLLIYAKGENSENIIFDETVISISKDESSKVINYELNMPDSSKAGTLKTDIVVLELPEGSDSEDNVVVVNNEAIIVQDKKTQTISTTNAIVSQVFIEVPYPGKYLDAQLFVNSANKGETATFTISAFSRGSEKLNTVEATIIIKGPTNEEIARINSNKISMEPGENGKVVANWLINTFPGLYAVDVIVKFDDQQITLRDTFMVGDMSLRVKDVMIDKFKLGQIAKVDVIAESVWNEEIQNVYAELEVLDQSGAGIINVQTGFGSIPPMGTTILSGYWDTEGMSIGNYDINIKLFFNNKISEKLFQAVLNADNIQISDSASLSGQVISTNTGGNSTLTLLIIAVIILIIVNITWLFYFKKFKKNPPQIKSPPKTSNPQNISMNRISENDN